MPAEVLADTGPAVMVVVEVKPVVDDSTEPTELSVNKIKKLKKK
jgi:hypothetical protein